LFVSPPPQTVGKRTGYKKKGEKEKKFLKKVKPG